MWSSLVSSAPILSLEPPHSLLVAQLIYVIYSDAMECVKRPTTFINRVAFACYYGDCNRREVIAPLFASELRPYIFWLLFFVTRIYVLTR